MSMREKGCNCAQGQGKGNDYIADRDGLFHNLFTFV